MGDVNRLEKWTHKPGSHYPTISFFFDVGFTLRALMKVGLNLIAAYCPNTPVSYESFGSAIRIIRDEAGQMPPKVLKLNGFVHAEDIQDLKAGADTHSFHLVHSEGIWHVYSCSFGGREVGSYVCFPGPNYEKVEMRLISSYAPIGSKKWTIRTSTILQYMNVHIEWNNSSAISPSLRLQNNVSSMRVEISKRKPR